MSISSYGVSSLTRPGPGGRAVITAAGNRPRRGLPRRFLRGRQDDPAWVRPALLVLLVGTALLYLLGLSASGYANSFYSGAVQAATRSWKAFFFGSSDAANFITVDKPPASLWVMDLSARVFGVSSWSILAPQALEGVAAVGLLYLTLRRTFSAGAGLLAGVIFAITPAATLMFRFNNPDALLALVLIAAVYATVRALESGRTSWLVAAGALVGLGFMTKMLQALVIVPVLAGVYLTTGPAHLGRRIGQLLAAGVALVVSAGWWVATVELIPATGRPFIGGSQDNSLISLILGYNGFGRLTGSETGSVGVPGASGGVSRLFNADFGPQISWLLPAAGIGMVLALWLTRQAPRTDAVRAMMLLWGGWLTLTGAVFSLGAGIIHPYYSVVLAPAIAAVVSAGVSLLWARRSRSTSRHAIAATVALTLLWGGAVAAHTAHLDLGTRNRAVIVFVALLAAAGVAVGSFLRKSLATIWTAGAMLACLVLPAGYSVATAATAHVSAIPSVGSPAPSAALPGQALARPGPRAPVGVPGAGGLLLGSRPSQALSALLSDDAKRFTWAAAIVGSEMASGYQLATTRPVMAIGGFNGTDPTPTLRAFERYVDEARVHYFIDDTTGVWPPGSQFGSTAVAITSWVEGHFPVATVSGIRLFDLAARVSPG